MKTHAIILCVYLILIASYTLHLVLFKVSRKSLPRFLRSTASLRPLPAISVFVSIILALVPAEAQHNGISSCSEEDLHINPDIGGIGVLLGIFLPCGILFLVLVSGHWNSGTFGAKEICVAQLGNLLYLAINLAKSQFILNGLKIFIACSTIEAVSASISMALSDKDVLASPKLVYTGFIVQLAAFATEGVALGRIPRRENPECLSSIQHPVLNNLPEGLLRIYLAFRVAMSLSLIPIASSLTKRLETLERGKSRSLQVQKVRQWELLPATLFSNYVMFFSFVLVNVAPAFSIASEAAVKKSWQTLWTKWGQSASFIVVVVVIVHICFSFVQLFSSEAFGHRVRVAKAIGNQTAWDIPKRSWHIRKFWGTLYQRQPFGKLSLHRPDELLVDYTQLLPYKEQLIKTEEEKTALWQELLQGFELNDKEGIIDCLERGAPIDRHDSRWEYPIHKSARFGNTTILQSTNLPANIRHLLGMNIAGETPLQIALLSNRFDAVRWITQHLSEMPPTEQIEHEVGKAFEKAIVSEHEDAIITLLSRWPRWQTTLMPQSNDDVQRSFLHFAIYHHRIKAATILLDHGAITTEEDCKGGLIPLEVALSSGSEDMTRLLLEKNAAPIRSELCALVTKEALHMSSQAVTLLLDCGLKPSINFSEAVEGSHWDAVEILLQMGLPARALDNGLTYLTFYLTTTENKEEVAVIERIKGILLKQRARDYFFFFVAAMRRDYSDLEALLNAESTISPDQVNRMVTATKEGGKTALHIVVEDIIKRYKSGRPQAQVYEEKITVEAWTKSVAVLVKHGAHVTTLDTYGRTHAIFYCYKQHEMSDVGFPTATGACSGGRYRSYR